MKKGQPTHMIYEFDNLYDGVVKQAQRYGDRDRYIYKVKKEERHFTYNDMLTHVNYISSAMTRLGVAGSFVGVTGDTHPDYVATYLATVACGGVIVPLDKDISEEQFVGFVDMCNIELVVYTHSLHKKILDTCEQMKSVKYFVCIDFDGEKFPEDNRFLTFEKFFEIGKEAYEAGDRTAENQIVDKEKLCTILFTSGTTGTSKGERKRTLLFLCFRFITRMNLPVNSWHCRIPVPRRLSMIPLKIHFVILHSINRQRSFWFRSMWKRCTKRFGRKLRKREKQG